MLLQNLCGEKCMNLLFHVPRDYVNIRDDLQIEDGSKNIVAGKVISDILFRRGKNKNFYKIKLQARSGELIEIVYFHADMRYLRKLLPIGVDRVVKGKLEVTRNGFRMIHPEYIGAFDQNMLRRKLDPIYRLTAGIGTRLVRKLIKQILLGCDEPHEWLEHKLITQNNWKSFLASLNELHFPSRAEAVELARQRLAYDELLAWNIRVLRINNRSICGISTKFDAKLFGVVSNMLGFKLTSGQKTALNELVKDQESTKRMMRLLQGDVGSGKTVVALLIMLSVISSGKQVVMMVPTELLAVQHYNYVSNILNNIGYKVILLTGKTSSSLEIRQSIVTGDASVIIGTHVLFQEWVKFRDLGLIVIDEQQRACRL